MEKKFIFIFTGALIVLITAIGLVNYSTEVKQGGTELIPLAQCLKDKGVVFYGAFWCSHCQATKTMFGAAKSYLPYVECSTPDGKDQLKICTDNSIVQYPTWVFPDGTRLTGEQTLQSLAKKAGCPLPGGVSTSTPITVASSSPIQ